MTREQFEARIDELIADAPDWLRKECIRLVTSGAVHLESAENNFRLPKNIFVVALENLSGQYAPPHSRSTRSADEQAIKNLRKF